MISCSRVAASFGEEAMTAAGSSSGMEDRSIPTYRTSASLTIDSSTGWGLPVTRAMVARGDDPSEGRKTPAPRVED
jgi:hypothetical protein